MKQKLIIFDFDGVLVDSSRIVAEYLRELDPRLSIDAQNELLCGNFHEELEKYEKKHGELEETKEQYSAYAVRKAASPLFDGIFEMLEKLHGAGHILTINTSAEPENAMPAIEKTGIVKFFDTIATKRMSKSKVEKFKILKEKYKKEKGIEKTDIIFVTDTLGDLREADIAGISTVTVTYGAHDRSYFLREPHKNLVVIIDTVGELGEVLAQKS